MTIARSSSQPLVSIGLVTWNSAAYLEACLQGIREQRYSNLELIVVDNDSQDGSLEIIRQQAPEAQIVVNDSNEGYCRAHNQAIDQAGGKYYLPLNPDVEMDRRYVAALVQALEGRPDFASEGSSYTSHVLPLDQWDIVTFSASLKIRTGQFRRHGDTSLVRRRDQSGNGEV